MKENRKVLYTRRVIKESFLALLREKNIKKITVSEICQLADIHRGTFYQHYHDVYELLDTIENELSQELKIIQEQEDQSLRGIFSSAVALVYKEREVCSAILGSYGDPQFLEKALELFRPSSYQFLVVENEIDEKKFEFIYAFFTSGYVGILQVWVENEFAEPFEEIVEYMEELTLNGLSYLNLN